MQLKNTLILLLVTAAVSVALTRHFWPKLVVQTQEVTKEVVRTDVRTVVRVVERPDGSKESVTEIIDHTVKHDSSTKTATTIPRPDWLVGGGVSTALRKLNVDYDVQVGRRVFGPIYATARYATRGEVGIGLLMEY